MTLEEEYENQGSWRESHDKLTFILCQPCTPTTTTVGGGSGDEEEQVVDADKVDVPEKMIGDINFFIYPFDEDEGDEDGSSAAGRSVVGEIDIMIASSKHRGKGIGKAAVSTFLHYIWSSRSAILDEYTRGGQGAYFDSGDAQQPLELKFLMAKIKATNEGSIALFKSLGFKQEGKVNYFGEVKLIIKGFNSIAQSPVGYQVVKYCRPINK